MAIPKFPHDDWPIHPYLISPGGSGGLMMAPGASGGLIMAPGGGFTDG